MLCPVALSKQTQLFHLVAVLCAGGHEVDARRVDAAVTENICQFCNILLHTIESPGKEFPHNLRKLFARTFYSMQKDIAKLADILGHRNINATRIYIMITSVEYRKQIERLSLLAGTTT